MSGRIVLFGATGYTGDLTARALVDRGVRPVLAARNRARLDALAAELGGLETRVADVAAPETLAGLAGRGDVLVSTVGPFMRLGAPAVEAAVAVGAHYLDSTGEGPFIRSVFERHGPAAEASGCGLVTAFGYDWVPGNLAGALALREAGERATSVDIGYFVSGNAGAGTASGGTRASVLGLMLAPGYAFRGGQLVTEPAARRLRGFDLGGRRGRGGDRRELRGLHAGAAAPGPARRERLSRVGRVAVARRPGRVGGHVAAGPRPGRAGGRRRDPAPARPGSTGGPDAEARSRVGSVIVAEAFDAGGTRLAAVKLSGVNPYDFTAAVLAWGAQAAANGGLHGAGALGPVDAFGLEALVRGCAEAGIARV